MTFEINGNSTFGMIDGDKIFDIPKRLPDATGLISLLDLQTQKLFLSSIKASDADYNLADVTFRRPIEFPGQVVCIGINYGNRDEEYETSIKGNYPNVFLRTPETLAAHDQAMLVTPESEQLDYEGEIAIVIGKKGRRIPQDEAFNYIVAIS